MIALEWNIYNGMIGPESPANRLTKIAGICHKFAVDVACMQEVPGALFNLGQREHGDLPNPSPAYAALNAAVTVPSNRFMTDYGAYAVQWDNPAAPPGAAPVTARTSGGYLVLYRKATLTIQGTPNTRGTWFQQAAFRQPQTGFYFRPPFGVSFFIIGTTTTMHVLNQHAEAWANDAATSAICLDSAVAAQLPSNDRIVICADLNVSDLRSVATVPLFRRYTDIVATYKVGVSNKLKQGLDHIVVNTHQANPPAAINAALNFTSDAYHYPIAASCSWP